MSREFIVLILLSYFAVLALISWLTSRNANNKSYFLADKNVPWYLVAYGMVGSSLSGVTFVSVPGAVGAIKEGAVTPMGMGYFQVVLGYIVGYIAIAFILLPLYYRLNLTSIYTYFKERFGAVSHKTAATFFLVSKIAGVSLRLYLAALVLHEVIFKDWIPFELTAVFALLLILFYTFKGGQKTLIWTDTLLTTFMLIALVGTIVIICGRLNLSVSSLPSVIGESGFAKIFFFDDPLKGNYFWKQFIGGAFIALTMTGMDQDMMQKNLTCRNIRDAKINMMSYSSVIVVVNLLFLSLGALLYMYAAQTSIALPARTDLLFPVLATTQLGALVAVTFTVGLIAAACNSADGALTALTTSVCYDIFNIEKLKEAKRELLRKVVHISMAAILLVVMIVVSKTADSSVIQLVLKTASYTYGPLLGLFAFGILTKRKVADWFTPIICLSIPSLCFYVSWNSKQWWNYEFGLEILLISGLLIFLALWVAGAIFKSKLTPAPLVHS